MKWKPILFTKKISKEIVCLLSTNIIILTIYNILFFLYFIKTFYSKSYIIVTLHLKTIYIVIASNLRNENIYCLLTK